MESSLVQFGNRAIEYTIHRSRREKTVAIGVDPIEGVRVRAPSDTPLEKLDEIVRRKATWILDRRRRVEDLPPAPTPRQFVSGETFRYLGRQYRLKVERKRGRGARHGVVRLAGKYLHVPVAGSSKAEARSRLEQWYRERASVWLPECVAAWAASIGVGPAAVLIRSQRKRWGSADSRGIIRLNWRIIQAPMRLVDYVVAHELVHLRFPDHAREFWAALGEAVGDYEDRREELRRLGVEMVW